MYFLYLTSRDYRWHRVWIDFQMPGCCLSSHYFCVYCISHSKQLSRQGVCPWTAPCSQLYADFVSTSFYSTFVAGFYTLLSTRWRTGSFARLMNHVGIEIGSETTSKQSVLAGCLISRTILYYSLPRFSLSPCWNFYIPGNTPTGRNGTHMGWTT